LLLSAFSIVALVAFCEQVNPQPFSRDLLTAVGSSDVTDRHESRFPKTAHLPAGMLAKLHNVSTMKFGERLVQLRRKEWAAFYLDYEYLKTLLPSVDESEEASKDAGLRKNESLPLIADGTLSETDFGQVLQLEVEKIVLFALQEQGRIANELMEVRRAHLWTINSYRASSQHETIFRQHELYGELRKLEGQYVVAGQHLLHLLQYVNVNVTGLRKILKKHDKLVQRHSSQSQILTKIYFGGSQHVAYLSPLLSGHDDSLGALIAILQAGLYQIQEQREQIDQGESHKPGTKPTMFISDKEFPQASHARNLSVPSKEAVFSMNWGINSPKMASSSSSGLLTGSLRPMTRKRVPHSASHGSFGSIEVPQSEYVLLQIQAARNRLRETSEFTQYMAASLMNLSSHDDEDDDLAHVVGKGGLLDEYPSSNISNFLNLMSTFLYMTNYFIVAPTSGAYAIELGGSATESGMIIGMTPVAALASTVLYSWWTSYSYRSALLFASLCSIIGNLLYASALPNHSFTLVLVGRLFNGFGSARSINRRYIADAYPRAERTAASATFVTFGALGMAAGPGLASILNFAFKHSDNEYWQVVNAPGWFMAGVWTIYLIALVFFFVDPSEKTHIVAITESEQVEEANEKAPLLNKSLGKGGNGDSVNSSFLSAAESAASTPKTARTLKPAREPPIWTNIPVMITFFLYFVLKLVLECLLSSTSTLTNYYFGWSGSISGIYMAWMSARYTDRELILVMLVYVFVGCLIVMQYTPVYRLGQYLLGSVVLFLSTNALEGPNMSLLSKTIPKSWSRGIFNVGLLATEAGTLGRAIGDLFLTLCGESGVEHLINQCFRTVSLVTACALGLTVVYYDRLDAIDKDD
jgi:MFS family permease